MVGCAPENVATQLGTPTHELQRMAGWKKVAMVERYVLVTA